MISASSVLGFVLLVGSGLLAGCQYIQDGDPSLNNEDPDINYKLADIEHLIRGSFRSGPETSPGEMIQWPEGQASRRKMLERIAGGVARRLAQSEAEQFRASMNGERAQEAPESIYLDRSIRYDVDGYSPVNRPDDQDSALSRPVNDPAEFDAKLGYSVEAPDSNTADVDDLQQLLMDLLNQTRDEPQPTPGEGQSASQDTGNQNSIGQQEIEHLVDRLDQWFGQPASWTGLEDEEEEQQQQQQLEQQTQQQLQQRDDTRDQQEVGGGSTPTAYSGSEYIDQPLALVGHQFVQGGAGEGRQLLGPDGTYENVQVIKTDAAIPSYCDPPNPCPLGYRAEDGCLEEFVNSASFSREYQAQQKCSCDNEHSLFNCAASISSSQQDKQQQQQQQQTNDSSEDSKQSSLLNLGSKLDTLARAVQNRLGNLAFVQRIIGKQQQKQEPDSIQIDNGDSNSDYLVRSARKLGAFGTHQQKIELD